MGLPHKTWQLHNLRQPPEICLPHRFSLLHILRLPYITILPHRMVKRYQMRLLCRIRMFHKQSCLSNKSASQYEAALQFEGTALDVVVINKIWQLYCPR